MNCLCCGKPFRSAIPASGWHSSCVQRFFGTEEFPSIELNNDTITLLAEKSVKSGYAVPGVQKKLSLHLSRTGESRLTLVDFPTGYILKPQVPEFTALPEAEHLVMLMANRSGLSVVPHGLIRMPQGYAYITRRIDRDLSPDSFPRMFAMEDFCQLSLRLTQEKYKASYEQCVRVIRQYSARPQLDISELFLRLVFCFLTGNSDMHLKNFSMIEPIPGSGEHILSPAYDLIPVNVLMPEDQEEFALQMSGKKSGLQKKHFLSFAEYAGIPSASAEAMIRSMLKRIPVWQSICKEALLPEELKNALLSLIASRADRLS